jgi:hypothetical protein
LLGNFEEYVYYPAAFDVTVINPYPTDVENMVSS